MDPIIDRSNATRRRVLKSGKLVFNNKSSTADCIVRSISDTGVGAKLEGPIALPDELELIVDGEMRHVRRAWQQGLDIGLEYI